MLQRSKTLKTFPQINWDHRDIFDLITMIQALEEFWKNISISCKFLQILDVPNICKKALSFLKAFCT